MLAALPPPFCKTILHHFFSFVNNEFRFRSLKETLIGVSCFEESTSLVWAVMFSPLLRWNVYWNDYCLCVSILIEKKLYQNPLIVRCKGVNFSGCLTSYERRWWPWVFLTPCWAWWSVQSVRSSRTLLTGNCSKGQRKRAQHRQGKKALSQRRRC